MKAWRGTWLILVIGLMLCSAANAAAAVRSGSETFNPNPSGPTFGTPSQLPLVTISVSYDDQAGSINVSQTGGDPSYFTGWAQFAAISVSGPNTSEVQISGDWDYPAITPTLSETGINGTLTPTVTTSTDGSTITATWASPVLAGQNLTFVNISQSDTPDNQCFCDVEPSGSFYFPGYSPAVTVTNPGAQRTEVGTSLGTGRCGGRLGLCCPHTLPGISEGPCPGLQIDALEAGLSNGPEGDDPGTNGTEPASDFSATGLPPGLRINSSSGEITGTPTAAGTYATTITASGTYNNSAQTSSGATTFNWTITAPPKEPTPPTKTQPLPRIPTFLGAPYRGKGLQRKPRTITYTGDGTGFFAGYGHASHRPKVGRLGWTKWTSTLGLAQGADWTDNCTPDCASGLRTAYRVDLKAYRPERLGGYYVFTRLTVRYLKDKPRYQHKRTFTMHLDWEGKRGRFDWSG